MLILNPYKYAVSGPSLLGGFNDNFDDNSLSASWQTSGSTISETGGKLQIAGTTTAHVRSVSSFNMTGDTIRCQFTDLPANNASYAQQLLIADGDSFGSYVMIQKQSTTLGFLTNGSGPGITWDPVAHAWVQIRFSGSNVIFETSPDGVTWTVRRTNTGITLTALYVYFRTFNGGVSATHKWDNFDSTL